MEAQALEHERLLAVSVGEQALEYAMAAAQLYMQLVGKAQNKEERLKFHLRGNNVLAIAERLKANSKMAADCTRQPPRPEIIILLRSSQLHGHKFPPWDQVPGPEVFASPMANGEALFTDPSTFSLSTEQQAIFAGWKRPTELFPLSESDPATRCSFMQAYAESDLAQDLATDCSVVASLCAAMRHLRSKKGSLLSTLIYPFDHDNMRPRLSPNGKYICRLKFNGCWRQVIIDDRLPSSSTDRTLFVVDKRNPRLIWPALVEKAYLKVRGGYDFPGSNSGTDLYALTGWIPEQIFLQPRAEFEPDKTWNRLMAEYRNHDVFVTLGTGNMTPEEETMLGIVKHHDYAVLDMKTEAGNRLLLVKNPWYDSLVWTGWGSLDAVQAQTAQLCADRENDTDRGRLTNTFWLSYEDVMQHFYSLYVNWNPALFTHCQEYHFKWEVPDPTTQLVYTHNPQYSVTSADQGPVWVLFSRHWQDGELEMLRQRNKARTAPDDSDTLANVSKELGYVALAMYEHKTLPPGHRVLRHEPHQCTQKGSLVDSPNTLLRVEPKPNQAFTLVVAQDGLPLPTYSCTLSFFSLSPLAIKVAPDVLPYHVDISGKWHSSNAGGSAAHASYVDNPQWALTVTQPTALSLLLSTDNKDVPVHVALMHSSGGKRVSPAQPRPATARHAIAASLEYERGCNTASAPVVEPGTYTLVPSTYEPKQLASFALRVSAAVPISAERIPSDDAGRFRTSPPSGPAIFGLGVERLRAMVELDSTTTLGLRAKSVRIKHKTSHPDLGNLTITSDSTKTVGPGSSTSSLSSSSSTAAPYAVRIALELGTGPRREVMASSGSEGEFADAALGLRTDDIELSVRKANTCGGLWIVVDRIGLRKWVGQGLEVDVLSTEKVRVGDWTVANGE